MKPFEIALFKHFIESKGMVTVYINLYRKYRLKANPISIEEFLTQVSEADVCVKAFYWVANSNYGYDYWSKMQLMWMEFLAMNENNYTADEWYKLQGMSKILRTNWDAAKHWKQESRYATCLRMGIDPSLIGAVDNSEKEHPTKMSEEYLREKTRDEVLNYSGVPEFDSAHADAKDSKKEKTSVGIFGEFELMSLQEESSSKRRLKDNEVSVNIRDKKGRITFNQTMSNEIKRRGGYEYASLLKNKKGEVVLWLNDTDTNGVTVQDGAKSRKNINVCISSKVLVDKVRDALNIKAEYVIINATELEKTDDYVAYLLTKK